jgi:hypothetical protein
MTIEQVAAETTAKAKATTARAKKVVAEEVAKAETIVDTLTEKAEKLADDVTTQATDLAHKVSDRVQAESHSIIEKVKSLIAQLQTSLHADKSFSEISSEATALIKEIQTNGFQALKNDYTLLRTTLIENLEKLQAKSSLKTFASELIEKLPSIKK